MSQQESTKKQELCCLICREDFKTEKGLPIPCTNVHTVSARVHLTCWKEYQRHSNTCPLCREPLLEMPKAPKKPKKIPEPVSTMENDPYYTLKKFTEFFRWKEIVSELAKQNSEKEKKDKQYRPSHQEQIEEETEEEILETEFTATTRLSKADKEIVYQYMTTTVKKGRTMSRLRKRNKEKGFYAQFEQVPEFTPDEWDYTENYL